MQLAETTTTTTSPAAPCDDSQLSEEEQINRNNETLPEDVTGRIKVHEYNNISHEDDEDVFDIDKLQPL